MATAETVFASGLSQMLRMSFSPPKVHLCLCSRQPGSASEPHDALLLMTDLSSFNQPASPLLVFSLLMLYSLNAREYKCSHMNSSAVSPASSL